jgi:type II restriction enzyme
MGINLNFKESLAAGYKNESQKARRLTEGWVLDNLYCPRCGNLKLQHSDNNAAVADFYCLRCNNIFELKSKNGRIGDRFVNGAYDTMIQRITSNTNPDFLFMNYYRSELRLENLILIPKHFFMPGIIEKRKPLSSNARRAGWTGCNIFIGGIPEQGRIYIVRDNTIISKEKVLELVSRSNTLATEDIESRGWLLDVLYYTNSIDGDTFSLQQIYDFESHLALKHPDNHHIKAKIRQQLQILRDKGYLEFLGNGKYRKII